MSCIRLSIDSACLFSALRHHTVFVCDVDIARIIDVLGGGTTPVLVLSIEQRRVDGVFWIVPYHCSNLHAKTGKIVHILQGHSKLVG